MLSAHISAKGLKLVARHINIVCRARASAYNQTILQLEQIPRYIASCDAL